jgi:transcriptional regulator with XRE-family HTH domain
MSHPLPVRFRTSLRKFRQEHQLTATDLAALCNVTGTYISRLEEGLRHPSLYISLLLELIFDTPANVLFPDLHQQAAGALAEAAARFSIGLEREESMSADAKRALLAGVSHRAAEATPQA